MHSRSKFGASVRNPQFGNFTASTRTLGQTVVPTHNFEPVFASLVHEIPVGVTVVDGPVWFDCPVDCDVESVAVTQAEATASNSPIPDTLLIEDLASIATADSQRRCGAVRTDAQVSTMTPRNGRWTVDHETLLFVPQRH
jgi:hypothetical protein